MCVKDKSYRVVLDDTGCFIGEKGTYKELIIAHAVLIAQNPQNGREYYTSARPTKNLMSRSANFKQSKQSLSRQCNDGKNTNILCAVAEFFGKDSVEKKGNIIFQQKIGSIPNSFERVIENFTELKDNNNEHKERYHTIPFNLLNWFCDGNKVNNSNTYISKSLSGLIKKKGYNLNIDLDRSLVPGDGLLIVGWQGKCKLLLKS